MAIDNRTRFESLQVSGGKLMETIENLIQEGNVRRITIKQGDQTVAEFPLTFGLVGAVLAPAVAGIGAVAALATGCTIEIERADTDSHTTSTADERPGPRPIDADFA
jgi:hypothetical protein